MPLKHQSLKAVDKTAENSCGSGKGGANWSRKGIAGRAGGRRRLHAVAEYVPKRKNASAMDVAQEYA